MQNNRFFTWTVSNMYGHTPKCNTVNSSIMTSKAHNNVPQGMGHTIPGAQNFYSYSLLEFDFVTYLRFYRITFSKPSCSHSRRIFYFQERSVTQYIM